ncbi:hypothetical protein CVM73_34770 [Bradyrhizobium forestalis]|uniref:Uncharacterized protein n=2 Tax=Bradyrhizobium forestalis TaxID=1419263 RepID=A0A2M8QYR2_9BRAD|nr:hypothetical protein CVM73_34770 [Bradyrhizobium forestalis]
MVPDTTQAETDGFRIDVSQVKPLSGAKLISAADDPVLRDLMATNWLIAHDTSAPQSVVPDNAPENLYAQVKVDGKVVATLYKSGSSAMTNQAAGKIGKLKDPPGLSGPDLAQWRADQYAERLGGTVEKAPTAITQSQWTPRENRSTTYSREQLDAAFQAMLAEGQKATAQQQSAYLASRAQAGTSADFSA